MKNSIIALIALAVISMSVLFHSNSTKVKAIQHAVVLKKQAEDTVQLYRAKMDSLVLTNHKLEQEVAANTKALKQVKQVNQALQQKVNILTADVTTETDTPTKLMECDSLAGAITELSVSNNTKDSLYEQMQTDLRAVVSNKDSLIDVQQKSFNSLQNSFTLSLAHQDTLENNCRLLQKQFNHQVVKKKFMSGALLTLSGITLYSLLRH